MYPTTVAIVGSSLGGVTTAEGLRRNGYTGQIALIGEEDGCPYDRPPLSKQSLQAASGPVEVAVRSDEEMAALDLNRRPGTAAQRLIAGTDGAGHRVMLADGSEIVADRVIVATGARARPLPFAEPHHGVFLLRTANDCDALRTAFDSARCVVVIGAGFLGLEVAASARHLGLDVTVVEAASAPLSARLGGTVGAWVTDIHDRHGVSIQCRTSVAGFIGHVTLDGVALANGQILPADVVVVAVGSLPNIEWLEGSGVQIDDGVVCDRHGRTSVSGVFAVGDVARYADGTATSGRAEHWSGAIAHAQLVAGNALAASDEMEPLRAIPYYWSDQYDSKLQVVGDWRPGLEETVIEGSIAGGRFGLAFRDGEGALQAAAAVNMPRFVAEQRRALQSAQRVEEVLS